MTFRDAITQARQESETTHSTRYVVYDPTYHDFPASRCYYVCEAHEVDTFFAGAEIIAAFEG